MNIDLWLDDKLRSLIPSEQERANIQTALFDVGRCLEQAGGEFRVAERYPCGSFEKMTMQAGRREADYVVVLRDPPGDFTLDNLKSLFEQNLHLAGSPIILYKAVTLHFPNGVKVDVLPVNRHGVTQSGPTVNEKFRVGLNGLSHVAWFRQYAHGRPIHPAVRLLKNFRDMNPGWRSLSSFAIEVLSVNVLHSRSSSLGGLRQHFIEVLSQVADGYLSGPPGRRLLDPADGSNDLLYSRSDSELRRIQETAQAALRQAKTDAWSAIFLGTSAAPAPATNLGGRTLA